MYSRVNYTVVGIFVLVFGTGVIWFAFWLAKYGMHREFDTYKLLMTESVTGLSKDSVVKLRGVDIGRVREIRIDPQNIERIEVFIEIKRGVPIKEDMVAYTKMLGVTGLLSIEIGGGTNSAKTLKPTEEYIPIIPTAPSLFEKAAKGLGSLNEQLIALLERSQELLSSQNIETVTKILNHTEEITAQGEAIEKKAMISLEEVDKTLKEFRDSMANLSKNFEEATRDFKHMQKDFAGIKDATIPAIDKLMQTTENFNRVTLKVERSLDRGDYSVKKIFEPMIVDIGILSEQLNDLSKEFEESPNDILFKSRKQREGPGE